MPRMLKAEVKKRRLARRICSLVGKCDPDLLFQIIELYDVVRDQLPVSSESMLTCPAI